MKCKKMKEVTKFSKPVSYTKQKGIYAMLKKFRMLLVSVGIFIFICSFLSLFLLRKKKERNEPKKAKRKTVVDFKRLTENTLA